MGESKRTVPIDSCGVCDMKDNLKNNKLDDSNLEKVSGGEGEGNSVGRSGPRYPQNSKVYYRGYGSKLFCVIRSSYVGPGWEYEILSYSEREHIHGVKEKDLSYAPIS